MNGCSDLFVAVLGSLPSNIPVEIEAIMRIVD